MMEVELEPEVEEWIDSLTNANYANLRVQINRLERIGGNDPGALVQVSR